MKKIITYNEIKSPLKFYLNDIINKNNPKESNKILKTTVVKNQFYNTSSFIVFRGNRPISKILF